MSTSGRKPRQKKEAAPDNSQTAGSLEPLTIDEGSPIYRREDSTSSATPAPVATTKRQSVEPPEYAAPVILPNREDLAVYMVPSTEVDNFQDSSTNKTHAMFFLGIFLGAIFGVIVNWATGSTISTTSILVFTVLVVGSIGFGIWLYVSNVRVTQSQSTINRFKSKTSSKE